MRRPPQASRATLIERASAAARSSSSARSGEIVQALHHVGPPHQVVVLRCRQRRKYRAQVTGQQQGVAQASRRQADGRVAQADDGGADRLRHLQLAQYFTRHDFLHRPQTLAHFIKQAWRLVGLRQQEEIAGLVHDAGKQRSIGIGARDVPRHLVSDGRDMGRVLPQLLGALAQHAVADAGAELAHHHGGGQRIQVAVAKPHHGSAGAGDRRRAMAPEHRGIGQGDGARCQHRFAQHLARYFVIVALRVSQCKLQCQRGIDAGGEYHFPTLHFRKNGG